VSSRGAATALGKLTWAFAIAFIITSLTLTVFAARNSADTSVLDRLGVETPAAPSTAVPGLGEGDSLLPPSSDTPLAPPPVE
jgi:preprotein translocase subunit SecG